MSFQIHLADPLIPRIAIPDRLFEVWDYLPDHRNLLLRSSKGDRHKRNVDIEFRGVAFVQLSMFYMRGLVLRVGDANDVEHVLGLMGADDADRADRLYVLEAPDRPPGYVAAHCVEVSENDLKQYVSSLTYSPQIINTDTNAAKTTLLSLDTEQRVPGKLTDLVT